MYLEIVSHSHSGLGPNSPTNGPMRQNKGIIKPLHNFLFVFFDVGTRYSIVQYPEDYFRWVLWKHRGEFYKSKKPEKHNPASTLPRHCLPRNAAYIHSYCEWTGTNKMCFQKLRHVPFPHYLVRLYIASLLPLTSRKKKEGLLKQPGTVVPHNTVKDILH